MARVSRRQMLAAMTAGAGLGMAACRVGANEPVISAVDAPDEEAALDPDLPIIDPHFHLRDRLPAGDSRQAYRLDDFAADIRRSGHRVEAGVFVECSIAYRSSGPEELRSLGETEYVAAAASAAAPESTRPNFLPAMIGRIDLRKGDHVAELLELHSQASGGRLRGARNSIAWDAYPPFAAMGPDPELYSDPDFRKGLAVLARQGMIFESWLLGPQISKFTALAREFPESRLILEHLGCPLGIGPYAEQMNEVFARWSTDMAELAACPNVAVKIGGMGPFWERVPGVQPSSEQLAMQWRPWIERSVELFGVDRCMFESNYPSNAGVSTYGRIWNAFKRVTSAWSETERTALFSGTARQIFAIG